VFAAVIPPRKPPDRDNKKTRNMLPDTLNPFIRQNERKTRILYGTEEITPVKKPLPLTFLYTYTPQTNPPRIIKRNIK